MAKQSSTMVRGTIRPGWLVPVAGLVVLGGLAAGFFGLEAFRQIPPSTTTGVAGFAGLAAAVVITIVLVLTAKREIVVDSKGVEIRARGGEPLRILWSEPHALYYRAPDGDGTGAAERVRLETEDGRCIDVGRVEVPDNPSAAVARVVERYSTSASWSRLESALEAGERASLGPIEIDRERLEVAGHSFPMDGKLCVQITSGKLRVGSQGKWTDTDVPVQQIGNFQCLLRAIGQVSQARPPG